MKYPPLAFYVRDYSCFGDEHAGFDCVLPINLIVGRNNIGKSTLLDIVEYVVLRRRMPDRVGEMRSPKVLMSTVLSGLDISECADRTTVINVGGREISLIDYMYQWVGKRLQWRIYAPDPQTMIDGFPPSDFHYYREPRLNPEPVQMQEVRRACVALVDIVANSRLRSLKSLRLAQDRDILPESADDTCELQPNGVGATSLIQRFLTRSDLDKKVVEVSLLENLNRILETDCEFTEIEAKRQPNSSKWEIYLEDKVSGSIPLSKVGNGIKTVLLVLCLVYLVPTYRRDSYHSYWYIFEELENNLHPALLRRLLSHLLEFARTNDSVFFLTTHSSAAIDMFAREEDAQIVHVHRKQGKTFSSTITASSYLHREAILDDLSVRASDVLQANAIIWVEGPSDRLYINRWIHLFTDGALREGEHYVCLQYGGSLLALMTATQPRLRSQESIDEGDTTIELDLTAEAPQQSKQFASILHVNRHAIVVMDSDKKSDSDQVSSQKQRIERDVNEVGGLSWITAGRDIENYLGKEALQRLFEGTNSSKIADEIGQFEEIETYLKRHTIPGYSGSVKVPLALRICPLLQYEDVTKPFDLGEKISNICKKIKVWNGL